MESKCAAEDCGEIRIVMGGCTGGRSNRDQ